MKKLGGKIYDSVMLVILSIILAILGILELIVCSIKILIQEFQSICSFFKKIREWLNRMPAAWQAMILFLALLGIAWGWIKFQYTYMKW